MKNCPHCLKELPVKKRKAKKFKLGYNFVKPKPATNNKYSWELSGWGIPESLKADNWEENPSFSISAYEDTKGFKLGFYTVERVNPRTNLDVLKAA